MDINSGKYYDIISKSKTINVIIDVISKFEQEKLFLTGGVLRNIVWNKLHNINEYHHLDDFDIIFYNDNIINAEYERSIQSFLNDDFPYFKWSVKNQARMHLRNGHLKYNNLEHAIKCFPETTSAVAIDGEWKIIAPYGLHDLLNLNLKPTTFCLFNELHIFNNRIQKKEWTNKYKLLRVQHVRSCPNGFFESYNKTAFPPF